jgi:hypothetical protein
LKLGKRQPPFQARMEGTRMSLDVPPTLIRQAEQGIVDEAAFVDTVRRSLPYAYELIDRLVDELQHSDDDFADNQVPPPSETERAQLLRALASDAIRSSLERHFGVRLAFQNCHRVAVFRPTPAHHAAFGEFTSIRAQLLNQSPLLRDC